MRLKDLYFKYIANDPTRRELRISDAQPEPEVLQVPFLSEFDYVQLGVDYKQDFNDL